MSIVKSFSSLSVAELYKLKASIDSELKRRKIDKQHLDDPYLARAEIVGYDQGFITGYNWPNKWELDGKPGGPYVYGESGTRAKYPLYAQRSKKINENWRHGWEAGHQKKIREKRSRSIEQLRSFDNSDTDKELRWLNSNGPELKGHQDKNEKH